MKFANATEFYRKSGESRDCSSTDLSWKCFSSERNEVEGLP